MRECTAEGSLRTCCGVQQLLCSRCGVSKADVLHALTCLFASKQLWGLALRSCLQLAAWRCFLL